MRQKIIHSLDKLFLRVKLVRLRVLWLNFRSALQNSGAEFQTAKFPDTSCIEINSEEGVKITTPSFEIAKYHSEGTKRRLANLLTSYGLGKLEAFLGDPRAVFIDVGANIGELGLALAEVGFRGTYVGLEPGHREYSCLMQNLQKNEIPEGFKPVLMQIAAADTDDEMALFVSSDLADSSLIEPSTWERIEHIEARKLDTLLNDLFGDHLGDRAVILKVEAEGYEPEVLRGAKESLASVSSVAVDGGFERGTEREATLPAIEELLSEFGFSKVAVTDHANLRARFERISQ